MNKQTTFNAISKVEVGLGYAHHHSPVCFLLLAKELSGRKSPSAKTIIFYNIKLKLIAVTMVCFLAFSCNKQKEGKSFETITQTFKYGNKQYTISFKLFSDDKMEEILGKDNEEFRLLIKSNPECVIYFENENGGTFFRNREEFCHAFPIATMENSSLRASTSCSGGGNSRVRFYRHNSFDTQMDVKVAGDGLNEYLAYHTNFGGPFCFCSDVATITGT